MALCIERFPGLRAKHSAELRTRAPVPFTTLHANNAVEAHLYILRVEQLSVPIVTVAGRCLLCCCVQFAEKRKRLQRRSQQQLPSPVAEGASLTPSADDVQGDGGGPGQRGASTPALSLSPNSDANVSASGRQSSCVFDARGCCSQRYNPT